MSHADYWDQIQALTRRLDAICREAQEIRESLRAIAEDDDEDDGAMAAADGVSSPYTERRVASDFVSVRSRPEDQN